MRCIAVMNQKGGCGKTTTVVSLAGCLAAEGHAVLVVDMDPQAHATLGLGVDPEEVDENLYEVLAEPEGAGTQLGEVIANAVAEPRRRSVRRDPVGARAEAQRRGRARPHRAAGHRDRASSRSATTSC